MKLRFSTVVLLLVTLGCSGCLSWYWQRVSRRSREQAPSPDHTQPRFLTDLFPPWFAAHALLRDHLDPYSAEATRQIQLAYFGSELDTSHADRLTDAQRFSLAYRFVYPLYTVVIMAPLAYMDFHSAQIACFWIFLVATLAAAFLWGRLACLRIRSLVIIPCAALFLSSIPFMQGLSILQPGLLVIFFIAAAAYLCAREHLFFAGFFLALSTIRPQMTVLATAWFLFWACSQMGRRRNLIFGFAVTMSFLVGFSEYLLPGWILGYPQVLAGYAGYTGASSLIGMLLPSPFSWVCCAAAAIAVAFLCWRARREASTSRRFRFVTCAVFTLTVLVVPTVVASFNQLLLLPALLLLAEHRHEFQKMKRPARIVVLALCGVAVLPWLLSPVFTLSALAPLPRLSLAPLTTSLALPFVVFGLLFISRSRFALFSETVSTSAQFSGTMTSSRRDDEG